jgi:hypothetical protein
MASPQLFPRLAVSRLSGASLLAPPIFALSSNAAYKQS